MRDINMFLAIGISSVAVIGGMISLASYQNRNKDTYMRAEAHSQWAVEHQQDFEVIEVSTEPVESAPQQLIHSSVLGMDITKTEYEDFARVVMNESGGESYACMVAVAQTIINRVNHSDYPNTISEVLNQPYQYSHNWNGPVNWQVYQACEKVLNEQVYAKSMVYFRDWYYHDFGVPYINIDEMYFSLKE